ncbi:MAG: tripartite tricarboxylate transporter TctB family protein [Candidatus Rokubacteria bacterium]|nr:tripartite tricarboxylate transporter TctB family protein [Candidatus Rokubacteria bacterium]
MRRYQIATAAAFAFVAAVAMFDSRAGALVDRSGTEPGGIGAGFYPFWSAALMLICAASVGVRSYRSRDTGAVAFEGRESVFAVLKLVIPMIVATILITWLGLYLVTGLYMGLFARWIGKYNWGWVALIAVAMPLSIYAVFELGFRVGLPKSFLYDLGLFPF